METATFADFDFNKQILNAVQELGYEKPTAIQLKAIPVVQGGHDLMAIAKTGTGKTAAYLLPIIMKVKYAQGKDPRALILVPTRELAMQVDKALADYCKYTDIRHVALYGGVGPKTQKAEIEKGVDIVVATPGRLLELYLDGFLVLKKLQFFVMDEADRLMDMGFIGQIHRILEVVPLKRQNLLFSATISPLVRKIAGDFLKFPQEIEIEPEKATNTLISQTVYLVPNYYTKIGLLTYLLHRDEAFSKVMIFCRTKTTAERVYKRLLGLYPEDMVRVIHGNKAQSTRINSMEAFRAETVKILVATDIAARGIDVTGVTHVINFDVPIVYEDYVHRIGRTGRAFATGDSITFCSESEEYHIGKIEKLIRQPIPVKKVPPEVEIIKTPYDEQQDMAREIDRQKRKEDPDFKGAFHDKKKYQPKKDDKQRSSTYQSKRKSRR